MQTKILIPARLASTRLPKKLLRRVGDRSILEHTYRAAKKACDDGDLPIVAVDDPALADEVEGFGGRFVMTDPDCPSGTDRLAAALDSLQKEGERLSEDDVIVNVQGDEPEIDPGVIRRVAAALAADSYADIATAATPIRDPKAFEDPSIVKAVIANSASVLTGQGRAVYFSRAMVPYCRDQQKQNPDPQNADPQAGGKEEPQSPDRWQLEPPLAWHHVGLYAYRRSFLRWFTETPPSFLEQTERLEQLRALEHGKCITVIGIERATPGIDTEADLAAFEQRWRSSQ